MSNKDSKINENALTILREAENDLHVSFNFFLERLRKNDGTPVGAFMNRVLSWMPDKRQRQYLYEMFEQGNAFSTENSKEFFCSFGSFVGNCLLDDSCYAIEWRKPDYLFESVTYGDFTFQRPEIQWLPGGGMKTMLTTMEDPDSRPVVLWAHDDTPNHSQDPVALLQAMHIMEQREQDSLANAKDFFDKEKE